MMWSIASRLLAGGSGRGRNFGDCLFCRFKAKAQIVQAQAIDVERFVRVVRRVQIDPQEVLSQGFEILVGRLIWIF
ncbi:hypothetical protein SAMN05421753_111153 [Planctomicrobium piriforme]|uniref:Uncharacterized protein n=1 Tax=Planctomicrobium piriforme TaxID=1576369 RepID=A0A1I3K8R2_9PLAN|nr:hypothetical protein SAMN05421753_111153 [Planctomicrobium piriforme]